MDTQRTNAQQTNRIKSASRINRLHQKHPEIVPHDLILSTNDENKIKQIALNRWMILGPFECGQNIPFSPKQQINPNQIYNSERGTIKWQGWGVEKSQIPIVHLREICGIGKSDIICFVSSFVYCRNSINALLIADNDCISKYFLNEKELLPFINIPQNKSLKQANIPVQLRHGWNVLTVECLVPTSKKGEFWAGFATLEGNPLPEIFVKTCFPYRGESDTFLFGKNAIDTSQAIEIGDPKTDWRRSNPDIVVYIPKEGNLNDGDNEHFLVFESPNSSDLLAFWNQSTTEPFGDNHIVMSRSKNGIEWSPPQWIIGTHKDSREPQASWEFPIVSRSGRIYCFYCKSEQGVLGGASSIMGGLYSDDDGRTWTEGPDIVVPTTRENPKNLDSKEIGLGFIVWQLPIRDRKGRVLVGYTLFRQGGMIGFMRFDNIDVGPDIQDIKVTWLPLDFQTIKMPRHVHPTGCQEPSVVLLPDGRLFVIMRTYTGYIWYSVSEDDGETWYEPEILRYKDKGEPLKQPLAPCPIYSLKDGRFVLLFHNNDHYASTTLYNEEQSIGSCLFSQRRPAFITTGKFKPNAHQPIWFSKPKQILDNNGVIVSAKATNEIATYTSFTEYKGKKILWYPDRKFYLLGKYITDEMLAGMIVE